VCSAISEVGLNDMKTGTGTTPVILSPQEQEVLSSSATTVQKRSVLRTEEIVSIFIQSNGLVQSSAPSICDTVI